MEASGCYCYIYRRDKPRLLIAHPLLMLEPFLPEDRFKRVHRSYIVNLYEVDGFIGKALFVSARMCFRLAHLTGRRYSSVLIFGIS